MWPKNVKRSQHPLRSIVSLANCPGLDTWCLKCTKIRKMTFSVKLSTFWLYSVSIKSFPIWVVQTGDNPIKEVDVNPNRSQVTLWKLKRLSLLFNTSNWLDIYLQCVFACHQCWASCASLWGVSMSQLILVAHTDASLKQPKLGCSEMSLICRVN